MGKDPLQKAVAIIGGGLSGAALAYHLVRMDVPARIVVIEPRTDIGRGLAYSAPDPDHRLNVPATKMTLRTDLGADFAAWLASDRAPELPADATTAAGDVFPPRWVFGQYAADRLAPHIAKGAIIHIRQMAVRVLSRSGRHLVQLADGTRIGADLVVLAMTHPRPALPAVLAPLTNDPRLIADPLAPGTLQKIGLQDRVIVIGAGLTSADILSTLARHGFAGRVQVISRHGWRSMPHGPKQDETTADFATAPAGTALVLLQNVRRALIADAAAGLTWHATIDRLRAQGPAIWSTLPHPERQRFLRHLRSLWDVHRFRVAPQTASALAGLERAGLLTYFAGHILSVHQSVAGLSLALRRRKSGEVIDLQADHIILATGPDHGKVIATNPVLADLRREGLIHPDPLGLGIETLPDGHAAGSGSIYVAGPLARGSVGELMGVPEVIAWSEHVARSIAQQLAAHPRPVSTIRRGDP